MSESQINSDFTDYTDYVRFLISEISVISLISDSEFIIPQTSSQHPLFPFPILLQWQLILHYHYFLRIN
ncbi:hypothetical protein GMMP15_2030002 [Candidatus Magnetomoraceae bacterium gMMP-15]